MPVDLGGAEEADVDAPALQPVGEHLGHRDDRVGGLGELAVADRQRQHAGLRADRAALVDEDAAGRVRAPGEVRGQARQADADEADRPVVQPPRRLDRHHLVRAVRGGHAAVPAEARLRRYSAASAVPSTWRVIQAVNESRSRLICVPRHVEVVVAVVVAVRVGRVRPAGHDGDRVDHPARDDDPARPQLELVDHLLDGHDRAGRREHDLFLDARDTPQLHVAEPVGLLGMHDADVRPVRRHGRQLLARERARDAPDARLRGQVGADVAPQDAERQVRRAGRVGRGHAGV